MLQVFKIRKALICDSLEALKITTNSKEGNPGWNSSLLLFSMPLFASWASVPSPQVSLALWPSCVWTPGSDSCSSVTSRCVAAGFLFRELILLNGNVGERLWEGAGAGVLQPGFVVRSGHIMGDLWHKLNQSKVSVSHGISDFHACPWFSPKKPQLSNLGTLYFSRPFFKSDLLQNSPKAFVWSLLSSWNEMRLHCSHHTASWGCISQPHSSLELDLKKNLSRVQWRLMWQNCVVKNSLTEAIKGQNDNLHQHCWKRSHIFGFPLVQS